MKFILKKSDLNNKGIKFKFFLEKDFYLIPFLETKKSTFFKHTRISYQIAEFEIMIQKKFYWFWFRISLDCENLSSELVDATPLVEKLFRLLPPKINVAGKLYELKIEKKEFVEISYNYEDESLVGRVNSNDLKGAINIMVRRLVNQDKVKFMKDDYKNMYKKYFKLDIPHERKFEPYYE